MTDKKQEQAIETTRRSVLPMGDEANNIIQWAKYVADAPYYQKMGGVPAIISIWLAARELGIPEMQALNGGMWCVQGRVILSAAMMNQMIWRAGHKIEKITHNAEICHLRGIRKDGAEWEEAFTMQDANKAGLTGKDNWRKHPKNMLFHSCLRNLARNFFPDVIGNCDMADDIIDVTPLNDENEGLDDPKQKESVALTDEQRDFLNSMNSRHLEYVDQICAATSKNREDVVKQAAHNPDKFFESFKLYAEKTSSE